MRQVSGSVVLPMAGSVCNRSDIYRIDRQPSVTDLKPFEAYGRVSEYVTTCDGCRRLTVIRADFTIRGGKCYEY